MKLTYFYATIEVAPRDSYSESLQCCTDRNDTSKLKFTFPYGEITPEQAAAVSEFTKTLTSAYNKLQKQIDNVNKDLMLEEYRPRKIVAETTSKIESESTEVSAAPQSCALGDEELSTRAERDIDKPKSTIVITKVTEEDDW